MRLYTPKEASKLLGVSVKTIRRWNKQGKIKCVRTIGGKLRVPESEIKKLKKELESLTLKIRYVPEDPKRI